jgi:hypothetical protein
MKTKKASMGHGDRLYRRLFRKEKFIGYNGGDRATPRPRRIFMKTKEALIPRRAPSVAHGGLFMGQKIFENYCINIE